MKKKYNKKRYKEILYKYPLVVNQSTFENKFPKLSENIKKNFGLTFKSSVLIYILISLTLTMICLYLQPNTAIKITTLFCNNNLIIYLLNCLPVFVITAFIGNLVNNPFIGCSLSSILFFAMSIINKYKISYRDEPLKLSDLSMAKEASSIVFNMNYSLSNSLIFVLATCSLIFFISGFIYKVRNKYYKNRLVFTAVLVLSAIILNNTVYSSSEVYQNIASSDISYHEAAEFNTKGFIYSFVYSCNNNSVFSIPDFYSQDVAVNMLDSDKDINYNYKPNIIYILSEAFMDIDNLENLTFTNENYPLTNYKQIIKDSIVSGDLIVPSFGGGTAYTEFELLTGINTSSLEFKNNPFESVTPKTSSVANLLNKQGYKTTAIHPGDSWFYKRTEAYDTLGFNKKIFKDEFTENDFKGYYISEQATYSKLIDEIKANLNNDVPDFYNLVSIHNHGGYDKLYPDETYDFESKTEMSDLAKDITKNYLLNLKDVDTELKNLTDYLNSINEPFVIVYYGDHLPYLGPNDLVYKEANWDLSNMNNPQTALKLHTTNYFIWANNVAKTKMDTKFINQNNLKNIPISSNYLSLVLFETIGFKDISPYFNYSKDLFKLINVYYQKIIMKDNTVLTNVDDVINDVISKWKILQYYFIQDEEVTLSK